MIKRRTESDNKQWQYTALSSSAATALYNLPMLLSRNANYYKRIKHSTRPTAAAALYML